MRLLVTNTHTPQAYAIVRALRPHAERIVALIEGGGLARAAGARSQVAACGRGLSSARRRWTTGRRDNPAATTRRREAAFVRDVSEVCQRERIDVIFPSWDPYVCVLSKNKQHFERLGVTVPVPDFATVLTALDKYRTIEHGARGGLSLSAHLGSTSRPNSWKPSREMRGSRSSSNPASRRAAGGWPSSARVTGS